MYIDDPLAISVIEGFGMAFGITIVVIMFIRKIGEKTNDLNACLEIILGARTNLVATITHLMPGASTLLSLNSSFNKFQSKLCENKTSSLTHLKILSPKHLLKFKPKVCIFFIWTIHSKTKL
jgi:hypothetical protein